jgi:hypothetical protein
MNGCVIWQAHGLDRPGLVVTFLLAHTSNDVAVKLEKYLGIAAYPATCHRDGVGRSWRYDLGECVID